MSDRVLGRSCKRRVKDWNLLPTREKASLERIEELAATDPMWRRRLDVEDRTRLLKVLSGAGCRAAVNWYHGPAVLLFPCGARVAPGERFCDWHGGRPLADVAEAVEAGLSVRTFNCFRRAGLAPSQAARLTDDDLLSIRCFGSRSLLEVRARWPFQGTCDEPPWMTLC